ncbi:MAG: hypothetical protein V1492_00100 [Candidatus Micrarchaeota archaeon]
MSKHRLRDGGKMADDSGPREKLPVGGAGENAGTGLSKPKKPREPFAESLQANTGICNISPGRRPSGQCVATPAQTNVAAVFRKFAASFNDLNNTGRGEQIDPVAFLRKITPGVLKDFNSIMNKPAPEQQIPPKDRADFNHFMRLESADAHYRLEMYLLRDDLRDETAFYTGLKLLERGDWYPAHSAFSTVARRYLCDEEQKVQVSLGEQAIWHARTIARAWAVAHASEYAELGLDEFKPFQKGRFYDGHYDRELIKWSALAVHTLEKIGELQDLPVIRIIGRECGEGCMEGYCTTASNQIRLLEGLRITLSQLEKKDREQMALPANLTDEQLAYRLSFIMNTLGLSRLFAYHPSMALFGQGLYGVVSPIFEKEKLQELMRNGLEIKFTLDRRHYHSGMDVWGLDAAASFARKNKLVEKVGQHGDCVLTPKGKELIKALVQQIAEIKIRESHFLEKK